MGVKKDNEDRVLVKKEQLEVRAIQVVEIIIKKIKKLRNIQSSVTHTKETKIVQRHQQKS